MQAGVQAWLRRLLVVVVGCSTEAGFPSYESQALQGDLDPAEREVYATPPRVLKWGGIFLTAPSVELLLSSAPPLELKSSSPSLPRLEKLICYWTDGLYTLLCQINSKMDFLSMIHLGVCFFVFFSFFISS